MSHTGLYAGRYIVWVDVHEGPYKALGQPCSKAKRGFDAAGGDETL